MRDLINKILRPQKKQLLLFGLLISPLLLLTVHFISFSWWFSDLLLKALYMLLAFIFIITFLIDRYRKTKLKLYIYITTILLSGFALLSYYTRDILKRKTEEQVVVLAESIEKYKIEFGSYPSDLEDNFFNESSKRSFLGTKFNIETSVNEGNDTTCYISYKSFFGYTGSYNTKAKELILIVVM